MSKRAWLALLAVWIVVYVGALWTPGLLDDADATHAEAAREMALTGDFVTLKVNGIRYLEKAPLPYWLVAISYKLFGANEFATRLPIALGVLALAWLAATWSARAFGRRAGSYAGLMVLTAVGVFLFTRIFIPEVILSFFIGFTLFAFLRGLEEAEKARASRWWYAGYVSLALGVLTKGLVVLAFVGLTSVIYAMLTGEWRRWREYRLFTGLLLFLLIAAPWHILAGLRNTGGENGRGFFWFYFVNEHILRFLGKRLPKDYNKMPAAAYWLSHLVWLFPWSLFLPLAVRDAWRTFRSRTTALDFAGKTRLLCTIYAAVILVFFAFSTNQEYYTYPVYLPLLILIAGSLARAEEEEESDPSDWINRWVHGAHVVLAVIGVAVALALIAGLWSSRFLPFQPDIGVALAKRGIGNYTLSMSHFFDLTGESFAALRLPAIIAAIAMLTGPIDSYRMRRANSQRGATTWIVLTMAAFLFAAHIALGRFDSYLSSKQIALELNKVMKPEDELMIYGDQAFGSSLLFYTGRPIMLVNGRSTSMRFGSTFPDAPKRFLDGEQAAERWCSSERRVFVFIPSDRLEEASRALAESSACKGKAYVTELFLHRGEKSVYSNRK